MGEEIEKVYNKNKKLRGVLRSSFTRLYNSLKDDLSKEDSRPSSDIVQGNLCTLESKVEELKALDQFILDYFLDQDADDLTLNAEVKSADDYINSFNQIKITVQNRLMHNSADSCNESVVSRPSSEGLKKKYKLPLIEFNKFSGEPNEWLPFWGQFQRIDDDGKIDNIDKFQYLLQTTVPGSRARKIVESYPQTSDNYIKALQALKTRFGRDDLLIEVYVRELLTLVINSLNNKVVLCDLYDKIESQLRALETLGVTSDKCAAMLYPLVESCLNEDLLRAWQRSRPTVLDESSSLPDSKTKLDNLMAFLKSEVESEERIHLAKQGFNLVADATCRPTNKRDSSNVSGAYKYPTPLNKYRPNKNTTFPTAAGLVNVKSTTGRPILNTDKDRPNASCLFCEGNHSSDACFKAREMCLRDRQEIVKSKRCCFACLKVGHLSKHCRSILKCIVCNGKHVPLMCTNLFENPSSHNIAQSRPKPISVSEEKTRPSVENSLSNVNCGQIYMQTLIVKVFNGQEENNVRLLFDSGSQRSYIKKSTAERMKYKSCGEEELIHGLFGGANTKPRQHKCYTVRLRSMDNKYACNFKALDEDNICTHVPVLKQPEWTTELTQKGITGFQDIDSAVEILVGSDIYGKLITGRKEILDCGLIALETHLGWIVTGKSQENKGENSKAAMSMFVQSNSIAQLWEMDVLGIQDPLQMKDKKEIESYVQEQFLENIRTTDEGRYEVALPWIDEHPPVPRNLNVARRRLETTIKKLQEQNLFKVYDEVFSDWQKEGIIEEVSISKLDEGHYLPHRPVIKENSTTKVRPVFDASSKEKGFPSLNQCLHKGTNLLEIIPTLLLRFRMQKIGIVADIKKAFLQISLNTEDRDFTKFLWVDNEGNLKVFRHTRVVFGITSSPFLLGAVINFHLKKSLESAKIESYYSTSTIEKLLKSFYVDNCVTSLEKEEDVQLFIKEATSVFSDGKFELRGWEYTDSHLEQQAYSPVLGLIWERKEDSLTVNPHCWSSAEQCTGISVTRRTILSMAQKIFDPIGVTSPISLCPKIILQHSWISKSGWDEEVEESLKKLFLAWLKDLPCLKDLNIPRCFIQRTLEIVNCTIHTFCDASREAYATAVFIRIEYSDSQVTVQLIQSKSRVAPIKTSMTIPRLELMAATIGARLAHSIKKDLDISDSQYYYWSDSTVTLAWIKRKENWGVFVRNRVEEIKHLSLEDSWRHVPGIQNPADLPSRGCSTKMLINSRWWEGPSWLKLTPENWPSFAPEIDEKLVSEERRKRPTTSLLCTENDKWYYSFTRNFNKVVRVLAWVLRFIKNCKHQGNSKCLEKYLSLEEVSDANKNIIKLVQQQSFEGVEDQKLSSLSPFMSNDGIICLKTKVSERKDFEHFKFPVVLPCNHDVVEMIVLSTHKKYHHVGCQGLLSILREHYWIIKGRQTIKRILNKCVICKRHNARHLKTTTPPLPESRVRDAAVFEVIGIDLAGPLFLRDGSKVWVCIFTCGIYRAVHLELVNSLSTDAFIDSLRRFIARRGRPSLIYSDNGTNFTGTEHAFKDLDWNAISNYSTSEHIDWRFNPPTAPWWGGWWERLIRLLKQLLRKSLGKASLTYQELETVLCDCESIMNSRPLTYISEDCSDLTAITPDMFLLDIKDIGVPDCDAVNSQSLRKRVRYRQRLREVLRKRFRNEYLGQLGLKQNKNKCRPIRTGEVVLIETENKKRVDWPLGLVEQLIPGRDGECRLVKLKTATGSLMRPIQRLYPLEMQEDSEQNLLRENLKSMRSVPKVKTKTCKSKKQDVCQKEPDKVSRYGRVIKLPTKYTD